MNPLSSCYESPSGYLSSDEVPLCSRLDPINYDLVSPDGKIISLQVVNKTELTCTVFIEHISPNFVGFQIDQETVYFNLKSTLGQLGIHSLTQELSIDSKSRVAEVKLTLQAFGKVGQSMLKHIRLGAYVGKLFAADERRRVRDPYYLSRMFGRSDRWGKPLLSLGGLQGGSDLILEKQNGYTIAYLTLQRGNVSFCSSAEGCFEFLGKLLCTKSSPRELLSIMQQWNPNAPRQAKEGEILLVKSLPLHVRTVFARVVNSLLPEGYEHTSASILQPDTNASGDIYELFGSSTHEITDIPLEFYTLSPYREFVFFSDRDQLQAATEKSETLFKAMKTAPEPQDYHAAIFIAKGEQLKQLKPEDWVATHPFQTSFSKAGLSARQTLLLERYIEQQPAYPFLKDIESGHITSEGILLSRYFPSPLLKKMLISSLVLQKIKGIYFETPSQSYDDFFSEEDRAMLHDLYKFSMPIFWFDKATNTILQYIERPDKDAGLFVPQDEIKAYLKATYFGIYGSNLLEGDFESELRKLLEGINLLKDKYETSLISKDTPLALVTGGGPGAMEVGNKVAKELGILSCANIVDFRVDDNSVINEQKQNPYVVAKMSYRLNKLVERQAEFHLDFPIFLMGGIGTDFEFCLEEVRRKTGAVPATPIILFGPTSHWKAKVTSRYQENIRAQTTKGSEWVSNCFYTIQTAEQGLRVYDAFFSGTLPIGKDGPSYEDGFVDMSKETAF
jgi:predicted Rossmann-fold nucleotide-binding protein